MRIRAVLTAFSVFLAAFQLSASELPVFGISKEIRHGSLDNGIEYFLVPNKVSKGFADVALVQPEAADTASLRRSLSELPHFSRRAPWRFLSDNGIGYSRSGYLNIFGNSAVYNFREVPVYDRAVTDSLMLMLFDLASLNAGRQAVIICGDIDAKESLRTLGCLSLMVEKRENLPAPEFQKTARPASASINGKSPLAQISYSFPIPRLSSEKMNTPVPYVLRLYAGILSEMLGKRIPQALREEKIPFTGLKFRYRDSSSSPFDELYSVNLTVSAADSAAAGSCVGSVLASLARQGSTIPEYSDSRDICMQVQKSVQNSGNTPNSFYLRRCQTYFLYGASLASPSEVEKFFAGRVLKPATELGLFNAFVSELLAPVKQLREGRSYVYQAPDSSSLTLPLAPVALVTDASEPVSGGRIWTFANGIRVVYKKIPSGGRFYYGLMLKGGFDQVPSLSIGEGPFVQDMFALSKIDGMRAGELQQLLKTRGVSMNAEVSLADMRITGEAPVKELPLLFKALSAISTRRVADSTAFDYYRSCKALEIAAERNVQAICDSLACPDYIYTSRKDINYLHESLQGRAGNYFDSRLTAMNNGVLAFAGDLDEAAFKQFLKRYLGNLKRSHRRQVRPSMTVPMRSGTLVYIVDGAPGEESVNMSIYARMNFNREYYMTCRLAMMAMEKELIRAMAPSGMYVQFGYSLETLPEERICINISCRPCRPSGLPEGVRSMSALDAVGPVREVLRRLPSSTINKKDLNAYKAALVNEVEASLSNPASLLEPVMSRYSMGKDFTTGYKGIIGSIDSEAVQTVFEALRNGCRIEYTIL